MTIPIRASDTPFAIEVEDGKSYLWCACGKSSKQPFCDGSHKGTGITPLGFTADESGEAWLCLSKRTGNAPYCDGTHKRLKGLKVGEPSPEIEVGDAAPKAEPTPEEPSVAWIHRMAREGLSKVGHHGDIDAMGVPGPTLPLWNDSQLLPAQMANKPLLDEVPVATETVIGLRARKPLKLALPVCFA